VWLLVLVMLSDPRNHVVLTRTFDTKAACQKELVIRTIDLSQRWAFDVLEKHNLQFRCLTQRQLDELEQ
jgi:hypothetical protein